MTSEKNISILVIDDEPMILSVLHGILADEGYNVFVAKSGLKGLDILKKKNIDIVLLDVWMPEMDGLETLIKIRERHPDIEVILMSGHGTEETVAKGLQLGASYFITKPMSLESLLDPIQAVSEKIEAKVIQVQPGEKISTAFYETICIYPGKKDILLYLRGFCSERFFRVIVAQIWTDVLAAPAFIAIIDPSMLKKREWSMLFDYLAEVPDTVERFALLAKGRRPRIPNALKSFFKTIEDRSKLGEYILRCNKEAIRRMTRKQRLNFINERRKDVKKILGKRGLQRESLIRKFARYYNVTPRTIQRDFSKIT